MSTTEILLFWTGFILGVICGTGYAGFLIKRPRAKRRRKNPERTSRSELIALRREIDKLTK